MHKITAKKFEMSDFSTEHFLPASYKALGFTIKTMNEFRGQYLDWEAAERAIKKGEEVDGITRICHEEHTKKDVWWQLIQLLPSSYNQRRTVMLNYEVLANIYKSRKEHKLDEWKEHEGIIDGYKTIKEYIGFCDWITTLPYSELITGKFSNEESDQPKQS